VGAFQGAVVLVSLASNAILARQLGPDVLGGYQYLVSWVAVAAVFGLPGMNVSITRACLKDYDAFFWWAFRRSVVVSAIGTFVVAAVGSVLLLLDGGMGGAATACLLVAAGIPAVGLQGFDSALVGKRDFRSSRLLSLFGAVLVLVLTAVAAVTTHSAAWTFGGYVLGRGVVAVVGLRVAALKLRRQDRDSGRERDLAAQGWRQTGLNGFFIAASQFDRLLLGTLSPPLLAYYHIGLLIPQRMATNSKVLLGVLTAHWGAAEPRHNLEALRTHGWKLFAGGALVAAAVAAFLPWIVPLVFGTDFEPAIPLGQLYSVNLVLGFWQATYMGYEQFQYNGAFAQKVQLVRQVSFFVLAAALIVPFQAYGLIAAHVGANVLQFVLSYRKYLQRIRAANAQ